MSKQVIVVPSGVISASELKELKENDYIVIVSDEPIKFLEKEDNSVQRIMEQEALYVLYNGSINTTAEVLREWWSRIIMQKLGVKEAPKK